MRNRRIRHALVLALMACMVPAATALAQEACDDSTRAALALREAQDSFNLAKTNETIRLLTPCFSRGRVFGEGNEQEALRLLALSLYYNDQPEWADTTVRWLMKKVDLKYRANPDRDPLFFQDLVKKYKQRFYQKTWVQVAFGAVVGGTLGFLFSRTSPEDLPGPPAHPPVN